MDYEKQLNKLVFYTDIQPGEVFREVVQPGLDRMTYFVSSEGRVISLVNNQVRELKQFLCGNPGGQYYCVDLRGTQRVNRLVAQAFLANPDNKPLVHHRDENKLNNCVNNLMWVTQQENLNPDFVEQHRPK